MPKLLKYLPICLSTNDEAARFLKKNASFPEGIGFWTMNQQAGRGQRGSSWESQAGENLALTLLFQPQFLTAQAQFSLSIAVALGVRAALQHYLPKDEVFIKWPNDILVNAKKLAGILIENSLQGMRLDTSLCGVGVNVNQQRFAHPRAVSLSQRCGSAVSQEKLAVEIQTQVKAEYAALKAGRQESQHQRFLAHLWKYQEEYVFYLPTGEQFLGVIQGVRKDGQLAISRERKMYFFGNKEVRFFCD